MSAPEAFDVEPAPDDLLSDFTDHDYALCLLDDRMDYVAQLSAVRDLLRRQKGADDSLREQIAEADAFARKSSGLLNEQAINDYIDRVHASVFQDAAHSMAAVGMLAPLIESIFDQCFIGIREMLEADGIPFATSHQRWQWSRKSKWSKYQWDAHFFWDGSKPAQNRAKGILELAEAVGLSAYLPTDLGLVLEALFKYRNKMFHCGFEWPIDERQEFDRQRINWPLEWFSMSSSDHQPWVFYLTDEFIEHSLTAIDEVLGGIGKFARVCRDRNNRHV